MSLPALEPAADELYAAVEPLQYAEAQYDYPLAKLCQAAGLMVDPVDSLVRDTAAGPGWSVLLDVNRAPLAGLPWLAQFVGVTIPDGLDQLSQRQLIQQTGGFRRGSPGALVGAAQQHLTGNRSVFLYERDTSPYHLTVVTYTSETPDEAVVAAALQAAKPAGLILDYQVHPGQDWQQLIDAYATWQDVIDAYSTWQAVINDQPT